MRSESKRYIKMPTVKTGLHLSVGVALLLFLQTSCISQDPPNAAQEATEQNPSQENFLPHSEEYGPPFEDTCKCSFKELGAKKGNSGRLDVYWSGKGWNPSYISCTWVFGESIANYIPEDTTVKDLKIHLLDVDSFSVPEDSTDYGVDSLHPYVIAVYNRNSDKCTFDPYKTGKYLKPKQWQD